MISMKVFICIEKILKNIEINKLFKSFNPKKETNWNIGNNTLYLTTNHGRLLIDLRMVKFINKKISKDELS